MNIRKRGHLKRPGFCIPVFFLAILHCPGQLICREAGAGALGGCFVTRTSSAALYNQAGLAMKEKSGFSISHGRPFLLKDLGVSQLSGTWVVENGGVGMSLGHTGMPGLQETGLWMSWGMKMNPDLYAGAGIFVEDLYLLEEGHQFSMSCAMGLLAQVLPTLLLGLHVQHPVSHPTFHSGKGKYPMRITAGLSYTFFNSAIYFSEVYFSTPYGIQWAQGLEIRMKQAPHLLLGWNSLSNSFSAGILFQLDHWSLTLSASRSLFPGISPTCTLTYAR